MSFSSPWPPSTRPRGADERAARPFRSGSPGKRYEFRAPWGVTRKCMPGGVPRRGGPSHQGVTGRLALSAGSAESGDQAQLPGPGDRLLPVSRAWMVPNRRAHHPRIPLPCHLRVTPTLCVRSYHRQMTATQPASGGPARYEIRVAGVLDDRWAAWFDGLQVSTQDEETVIGGLLADQSALHGLLTKVRDLGLCLISVRRLDTGQA